MDTWHISATCVPTTNGLPASCIVALISPVVPAYQQEQIACSLFAISNDVVSLVGQHVQTSLPTFFSAGLHLRLRIQVRVQNSAISDISNLELIIAELREIFNRREATRSRHSRVSSPTPFVHFAALIAFPKESSFSGKNL